MQEHAVKRRIESQVNPEDISYGFISPMFREKEQRFDRDIYKRELKQQAEEQKRRKQMENHMSPEEYKFNLNQLNVAISTCRR